MASPIYVHFMRIMQITHNNGVSLHIINIVAPVELLTRYYGYSVEHEPWSYSVKHKIYVVQRVI
jgi:hypothetical protein